MSKIDYIPRSHDEFHRWQEVFISRLQEKLGSFKLVAENVKALLAAQSKYELAYSRAANTEGG